ncbi:MAG: hypothetical protein IPN91_01440 [Holophagaceae bacterium]|uniref:Uncharacterized protein n=1 Tax=Candidatus Geothrix odensensis TaxID=2954440 RepID=A0A936K558_9BACT|nr:hypothetical protein [Candidatus Geothrix odensensis]
MTHHLSKKPSTPLLVFIAIVGFFNFVAYMLVANNLGGDAVNGSVIDGRYFLANHGILTETSRGVFWYSRIHTYTLWVTHPLAIFSLWRLKSRWKSNSSNSAA